MANEYPKIETLFDRDEGTHRVIEGKWRRPEFDYLKENSWLWTEKVDGTHTRVTWAEGKVGFGDRNDAALLPPFLLKKLQELFHVELFQKVYPDTSMILYGEGYGARIQKGGGNYIKDGVDFVLFDVRVAGWWLERHNVEDIAAKLGIRCVPVIGQWSLEETVRYVKRGFLSTWGNFAAEGLVLRPVVDLYSRNGARLIAKLKTRDF